MPPASPAPASPAPALPASPPLEGHVPQSSVCPQPSETAPQVAPCAPHVVVGMQCFHRRDAWASSPVASSSDGAEQPTKARSPPTTNAPNAMLFLFMVPLTAPDVPGRPTHGTRDFAGRFDEPVRDAITPAQRW